MVLDTFICLVYVALRATTRDARRGATEMTRASKARATEPREQGCQHGAIHRACVVCGECVRYPDGLNLRGGREVHAECYRTRKVA